MFDVADELIKGSPTRLSTSAAAEACVAAALQVAALAAVAARIDLPDLTEMLADNVRRLRQSQDAVRPPGTQAH